MPDMISVDVETITHFGHLWSQ